VPRGSTGDIQSSFLPTHLFVFTINIGASPDRGCLQMKTDEFFEPSHNMPSLSLFLRTSFIPQGVCTLLPLIRWDLWLRSAFQPCISGSLLFLSPHSSGVFFKGFTLGTSRFGKFTPHGGGRPRVFLTAALPPLFLSCGGVPVGYNSFRTLAGKHYLLQPRGGASQTGLLPNGLNKVRNNFCPKGGLPNNCVFCM